jgi:hypothetical protein
METNGDTIALVVGEIDVAHVRRLIAEYSTQRDDAGVLCCLLQGAPS